jgi:hypothetical protein
MAARAEYYKRLLAGLPNVTIHEIDLSDIKSASGVSTFLSTLGIEPQGPIQLPPARNESKSWVFPRGDRDKLKRLLAQISFDPAAIAARYFDQGNRLGIGPRPAGSQSQLG